MDAKFGKDNSGMVPINRYEFITICSKYLGNPAGWPKHIHDCFDEILDTFSQQPPKERNDNNNKLNGSFLGVVPCPNCMGGIQCDIHNPAPKERKVSLEEIINTMKSFEVSIPSHTQLGTHKAILSGNYEIIGTIILSLLNATEERKGAEHG